MSKKAKHGLTKLQYAPHVKILLFLCFKEQTFVAVLDFTYFIYDEKFIFSVHFCICENKAYSLTYSGPTTFLNNIRL